MESLKKGVKPEDSSDSGEESAEDTAENSLPT